jgi:hypothetical protein
MSDAQRNISYARLETAKLLTVNRDAAGTLLSLDAHPLLREYFALQLRTQHPDAWHDAHRRLYEHLCASTQDGDQPTLDDLQPLYQAVAHGHHAGMQEHAYDNVYLARIAKGEKFYSIQHLGALGADLGAVACFFDQPWSRISVALRETSQSSVLGIASFILKALGRLTESLEPMRAGLTIALQMCDWKNAAIKASNLSELELLLGKLSEAAEDAKLSVVYADRSGDAHQRLTMRTSYARALHHGGHSGDAKMHFEEAEIMQGGLSSAYPLLYGVSGFWYCDLLLIDVERFVWRRHSADSNESLLMAGDLQTYAETVAEVYEPRICSCPRAKSQTGGESSGYSRHTLTVQVVSKRVAQAINIAERSGRLLDLALDHLTLGRAELYRDVLEQPSIHLLPVGLRYVDYAVLSLRRSGMKDYLPYGLLTRAWLRSLSGAMTTARHGPDSAQSDLNEAWEIAERGPMKLFMADIHLYRARLFFREAKYPWVSPADDLAAAEKLINDCGYHRRDEELADAKRAILGG